MTDEELPCECGSHCEPPSEDQRRRILRSWELLDGWLQAAHSGVIDRSLAAMDKIHDFLDEAPSSHDANVRLAGLVIMLGRRCAQKLPLKSGADFWGLIFDDDRSIDDVLPSTCRFAFRLMVAYANDDEPGASDLIHSFIRPIDHDDLPAQLVNVLFDLTNIYFTPVGNVV